MRQLGATSSPEIAPRLHLGLQRRKPCPQLGERFFVELLRAGDKVPRTIHDLLPQGRIFYRGRNIAQRAQQPQAHREIRLRVQPDLFECGLQQPFEIRSRECSRATVPGRIVEAIGRLARREADQNAAQLVDAADRRGGIVDRRRDRLQRDIDNLQNAELHILLQRPRRPQVESPRAAPRSVPAKAGRPRNHQQRRARRNEVAHSAHSRILIRYSLASVTQAPGIDEPDIARSLAWISVDSQSQRRRVRGSSTADCRLARPAASRRR